MHGLELTPARYDLVVSALGGHGELLTEAAEFAGAIERSLASGKASCVNVTTESIAAPVVRLAS
jgi:acetolactate synthase-1/2/3 large subunit